MRLRKVSEQYVESNHIKSMFILAFALVEKKKRFTLQNWNYNPFALIKHAERK